MTHASPAKKALVEKLVEEFARSQVIGVVNIQGIPAAQFQRMRRKLRNTVNVMVTKNNLLMLALEQAASQKAGLEKLKEVIEGQSAVVTASLNPFKLYKAMEATKTSAPAKGGEIAPIDIWVQEGETPFKPGPVVGDLQKAGIPAAIEKGKVVIKKDKLLVPKGERIQRPVAQALTRLEIFPLIVGLDLRGAFEDGMVYGQDVLAVDDAKIMADLQLAGARAFNLAVNIAFPTKTTIETTIHLAHSNAINLAVNTGIMTKESIPLILAKAQSDMMALASLAPDSLDEELRARLSQAPPPRSPEEGKEDKKEEKKEEKVSEDEAASGLSSLFG